MSLVAFDFDGTLVDGDAGVHFARRVLGESYLGAVTQDPLSAAKELTRLNVNALRLFYRNASLRTRYQLGDLDRQGVVQRAYQGFEGLDADWVEERMADYAREHLPHRLREGVVDQMRHHAEDGDHVVVVSTGIHGLIWPLRDRIGVDFEVVACRLRRKDGTLTGTVEGPLDGTQKLTRIVAIAKRRDHDLEDAWAYADHEDDVPILQTVGNPVAVHPTRRLERAAREHRWPILYDD